ncbi:MAG: 50S ribosomal protein L18, partial [Candidatus Brocadiia bacterium]|nr:50S ribosomal protein L18 [Candidatus Brocadiia bacterium]
MDKHRRRARLRVKRHGHIRRRLSGTAERPRLCVFRSNKHMYAQVIDDALGHTLISACTLEPQFSDMGSA